MKHISIIIQTGKSIMSSIVGTYDVFTKVNEYLIESGKLKTKMFDIDFVGLDKEMKLHNGIFTIKPSKTIHELKKTDLIIITSPDGDLDESIEINKEFIPWILNQRIENSSEIASLCVGAFLLAETGLLNGKSCSTHWVASDYFKMKYPKINLIPEKIITEENGIYTSGGAFSFLNLILHLIEKYCGRETAIWCSKMFEIEFDRVNQNYFAIFNTQKNHKDETIIKAQHFIENNYGEKINVEELANMFASSRRNFVRRFKRATSNTPLEYIQRVKIEAAKKSFEASTNNISDVMFSVGYNDNKAFRSIFRKFTGLSPLEYRNKYNREMAIV
jgi:transcriptional regulator GlxA family with amidase domain